MSRLLRPSSEISRRELLSLMLGTAIGTQACRRKPPRPIPGAVIGGDRSLGHRIRHGSNVPETVPNGTVPVVIVGAGIAGLSAAWRLERQGEPNFRQFELESRAGGTSTYGTDGIVPYPWAAHYLPMPKQHHETLCALLLEMGVVERAIDGRITPLEQHLVRDPEERLFIGGEWVEGIVPNPAMSPADQAQFARFQTIVREWIVWRDSLGRRAFDLPLAHCSDDAEAMALDKVSAAAWLASQRLDSKPLLWMLEYACRDDYGGGLETTSAWALLFYHAARVSNAGEPSAPFLTWPEGNGHIVRHLERVVGDRLTRGQLVVDVKPEADRVKVTLFDAKSQQFQAIWAEYVILATPSFITKQVVRPWRDAPPAYLADFTYSPWLVANLHLRSRPRSRGFGLAWDNVVYQGASLGYVVATHQTLDDDGPTIWTYYQPMIDPDSALARQRLAAASQVATWDAINAELAGPHPDLENYASRLDVWQFGHAMIRAKPGFVSGQSRRRAAQPVGRLHFAHTDLSGVPLLDEAHFHGVRAADEVLGARRGA